jgi:hypothetical protein
MMTALSVKCGRVEAVVSKWVSQDGYVRYVVKGKNGGSTKELKTLDGAMKAAKAYVIQRSYGCDVVTVSEA